MTAVASHPERSEGALSAVSADQSSSSTRDWRMTCLNCGAPRTGPFCAECGQRAAPPHPTLRELGGQAFSEFSGWDGKIAATLRTLLTKPGKLTLEFLEGRRARFLSPLRVYLMSSVVYFLLAAATPTHFQSSLVVTPGPTTPGAPPRNIVNAKKPAGLSEADRQAIQQSIATAPAVLRPLIERISADVESFQAEMFVSLPKALFGLLPVFAGLVALFFRKRHFAEHLYFAIHLHTFLFAALIPTALSRFSSSLPLQVFVGVAVLGWIPIYTHLAFKRVYGESAVSTLLKEIAIGALYIAASIPAIVILAIWVASH